MEKHGFKVSNTFFKLLPYSSIDSLDSNELILGIRKGGIFGKYLLGMPSLLKNEKFRFGNEESGEIVGCPFIRNKEGNQMNKTLSTVMLKFLEKLYVEVLVQYEKGNYRDVPDFVKYLRGDFEVSVEHLEKYPKFFEKI